MAPPSDRRAVAVRIAFGNSITQQKGAVHLTIYPKADGSDTIEGVKQLIAEAAGGNVTAADLQLSFGPNDRKMGKQYQGDPTVQDSDIRLAQYSVLPWLERFPSWALSARLLPAAPPPPGEKRWPPTRPLPAPRLPSPGQNSARKTHHPPHLLAGVAIQRAAAVAEQQDPDRAVQDARAKGEIPKINDLPAPWGPKPFVAPPAEELARGGYLPAAYPAGSSPAVYT